MYYILLLSFLGITAYVLFFSSFLQIKSIAVQGTEEINDSEISDFVQKILDGKYFEVIPKNNFILLSENKISRSLMQEIKKLNAASIEKIFPDTLKITVIERKSLILWCSAGPCYIIDEKGYAYTNADFDSPEIKENNLIRLVNLNAKPTAVGEKVLEENFISFILEVGDEFEKEIGQKIEDVYFTPYQASEEVQVRTHGGWNVYLISRLPLPKSHETLRIFLQEKIGGRPEDWNKLEYVDLRWKTKFFIS